MLIQFNDMYVDPACVTSVWQTDDQVFFSVTEASASRFFCVDRDDENGWSVEAVALVVNEALRGRYA